MEGARESRYRVVRGEPELAGALHQLSAELIRAAHQNLEKAIHNALAAAGEALAADRALVVTPDPSGAFEERLWDRRMVNGHEYVHQASEDAAGSAGQILLDHTLVCERRQELPSKAVLGVKLSARTVAAILVPLRSEGKTAGLLVVGSRTPRPWTPGAVEGLEQLARMLAAALDRLASESSLAKEQEKRLQAEAETRRLREQLAHGGRVSMLGEMAASLAHELNQPLTAIYTNAQAAHRFLDRKPPATGDALAALHDLGQDCRRAGDVLGRLRQMFRRHETERVPLAVGPLVEHVLMLLHEDSVVRGIHVVLDVKPGLPLVYGDRVQLEQVVMNLLVNAFDAVTGMADRRDVTVRASARGGDVEVAVLDTGRGIARVDMERIFEPFFTRKPHGMGMGLAICRAIAEAHGGRISGRNRTERGSVFELTLPTIPAAESGGVQP